MDTSEPNRRVKPSTVACIALAIAAAAIAALSAAPALADRGDPTAAKWMREAGQLEGEGALEGAVAAWERAFDAAPAEAATRSGLARARAKLGEERLQAGDPATAVRALVGAVALVPNAHPYRLALAYAYRETDEPDLARGEAQAVIELDPKSARAFELLGRLAYDQGRLEEAARQLERASALDRGSDGARNLLARARRELEVESAYAVFLTASFKVQYPAGDAERRLAERVARELELAYGEVGQALGYHPRQVVTVLLYPETDFRAVTGAHDWVGALYDGKIRIPLSEALVEDAARLASVARHEYVHALIAARTRRCPTWLHEGLAQHFEGKRADDKRVAAFAEAGALPSFRKLGGGFAGIDDRRAVEVIYAQSLSFTRFLIGLRGSAELSRVLSDLGRGASLDAALEGCYGEALDALEARWRAGLPGAGARPGGRE